MEKGTTLYYVNLVLKWVLLVLIVYCLFLAYHFFSWFDRSTLSHEEVIDICNTHALQKRDYGYCCEQYAIYYNQEIIGSSCYGLRSLPPLTDILSYECGGVTCS